MTSPACGAYQLYEDDADGRTSYEAVTRAGTAT